MCFSSPAARRPAPSFWPAAPSCRMPRWRLSIPVRANRPGLAVVVLVLAGAIGAPFLAPHSADRSFPDLLKAPPTLPHFGAGGFGLPFIHPWRIASRLEQRYEQDTTAIVPLTWLSGGHLGEAS